MDIKQVRSEVAFLCPDLISIISSIAMYLLLSVQKPTTKSLQEDIKHNV